MRRYHSSNNPRNWRSFLQSSRGFAVQERGLKGQSRRNFDAVNNAQRRKHFRYLFLLREPSQKRKRWGNTQTYPLNMLMNELESSYWWNSGWHCKNMVSYFVSKSMYYNSWWFGQFFFSKIWMKSSTTDMFCRLKSFVRGILQTLSIGLKETLIQRADWSTYLAKKASVRSDRK